MKKEITGETRCLLEHYGIELTPEIEAIFTEEPVKPVLPDFQKITKEIKENLVAPKETEKVS